MVLFTVLAFETRGLALRFRLRCLIAAPHSFDFNGDGARTFAATEIAIHWMGEKLISVKLFDAA